MGGRTTKVLLMGYGYSSLAGLWTMETESISTGLLPDGSTVIADMLVFARKLLRDNNEIFRC